MKNPQTTRVTPAWLVAILAILGVVSLGLAFILGKKLALAEVAYDVAIGLILATALSGWIALHSRRQELATMRIEKMARDIDAAYRALNAEVDKLVLEGRAIETQFKIAEVEAEVANVAASLAVVGHNVRRVLRTVDRAYQDPDKPAVDAMIEQLKAHETS